MDGFGLFGFGHSFTSLGSSFGNRHGPDTFLDPDLTIVMVSDSDLAFGVATVLEASSYVVLELNN